MRLNCNIERVMKRIVHILLVLLLTAGIAEAQPAAGMGQRGERAKERIKAIKVGYLTEKLKLTPEQAAKFWPVYNRYEDELRQTRRAMIQKHKGNNEMTREEAMQFIDDNLDYQEAELKLKRKYNEEFMKVLPPEQLAELYKAERDFKTLMLNQIRKRNAGGQRPALQQK
jgi:hypothetical protein